MIQNEHDTYSSSVMIIKGCMLFLYSTIAVLSIYYRVQYDNILRRVSSRTRKPDRNGERLNIERTQFLLSTFYFLLSTYQLNQFQSCLDDKMNFLL